MWSGDQLPRVRKEKNTLRGKWESFFGGWNGDESPRVKKETRPTLRAKWEGVFNRRHMDNVPKETHVVSVMTFQTLETVALVRDEKGDRRLPHTIPRQNGLTARNINPHRNQTLKRKLEAQQ